MQRNPYLEDRDKKNNASANLPVRLNILLGISLTLMIALIVQLAFLTIKQGAYYQSEVNRNDETIEKGNTPRGMFYDSTGRVIAGNKAQAAITFTRGTSVTGLTMRQTAIKLSKLMTVDTKRLSERSKVDFYLASKANNEKISKKITKAHKDDKIALTPDQINNYQVAYVQKHHLADHVDSNAAMIFQRMSGAYTLSTTFIKESDVTNNELAEIGEHLSEFPGIKLGTSWSRQYPEGTEFKSLVGTVTNEATGLPEDRLHTLLAQGYSQNEPVGNSSLEKGYESILKGSSSQTLVTTGSDGQVKSSQIKYNGQAGDNVKLTINAQYQNAVQKILEDNLPAGDVEGAYATVINPYTGGVYAMGGVSRDYATGKKTANPLGNMNAAIVMGSVVKPAVLATAFQKGVISQDNTVLSDQGIKIQGTQEITSYWNKAGTPIPVDAQTALERSSNTYFVQLGMKIGGQTYSPGAPLGLRADAFQTLRNGLGQFGLGTKTGIDIDGETAGYRGPTTGEAQGKYLYESFGQYDSYTTLQLARYVSTIANGGYLVAPHVVGSVLQSQPNSDKQKTVWTASPSVQGQVNLDSGEWDTIKSGMNRVANGSDAWNTGGSDLHKLTPHVYAKTGTAETKTNGHDTFTESMVAYVPGQPMAMALAIPGMNNYLDGTNGKIAAQIIDAYWKYVEAKPDTK
ncbi:penicillin-binding transpeptidase domain-containing protein [Leuconostoc rapi]|uniref:penicillin-binding transpeptidase domain-containing protein n=1 Tax=Leuconostoc rapi TaxID=1406906 RepID=UPI00195C6BDC|nr:penicillin-binding transpeptidase domain-containing protein [Leuconostoc rapi]MBM7436232.1 cell division protein FtsI/penicillin-binding protein 2 [Leuconostoc rapi]